MISFWLFNKNFFFFLQEFPKKLNINIYIFIFYSHMFPEKWKENLVIYKKNL
jgi:hypothetical protein